MPLALFFGPNDSELVAVFLSVVVGAVVLTASLAALLMWIARGHRRRRLPQVTPLDDQIASLWQRQLKMPPRIAAEPHRRAA